MRKALYQQNFRQANDAIADNIKKQDVVNGLGNLMVEVLGAKSAVHWSWTNLGPWAELAS